MRRCTSQLIGMFSILLVSSARADELPELGGDLTTQQVTLFAELALKNIDTEFPNKPSNVMKGPESVLSPKQMHPAFYGCFDWHSSVHGHWMLVRLQVLTRTKSYLPLLTHPIRVGEHFDTGFALAQILDNARIVSDRDLESLMVQRGRAFYLHDSDYPFRYEPSGQDFFSSGLNEADFVRRVTTQQEFAEWLGRFFPADLSDQAQFVRPVAVIAGHA